MASVDIVLVPPMKCRRSPERWRAAVEFYPSQTLTDLASALHWRPVVNVSVRWLAVSMLASVACADRPLEIPLPAMETGAFDMAAPPLDLAVANAADLAAPRPGDLALADLARPGPDLSGVPLCQAVSVSTLAGNGKAGFVDGSGGANGTTEFNFPSGLAVDSAGYVYVADPNNSRLRKVAPDGTTTTAYAAPPPYATMLGVAVDAQGNLYASDYYDNHILKIVSGVASTLAGNGATGFADGSGGANGTAKFFNPNGLAIDASGNVYVADSYNDRIRKVAPDGTTTTVAGDGDASFLFTRAVAVDGLGNIYATDEVNTRVYKVAPDHSIKTLVNSAVSAPTGIAVDQNGYVYIADSGHARIVRLGPDGTLETLAGDGNTGFTDGAGCVAQFSGLVALAVSDKLLFASESDNIRVRRIQLP
jgi:sugar lactone lactonase YvrE